MKKIIVIALLIISILSTVAEAAPQVIYPGNISNSANSKIITITNPPSDKAATFDKSYIISGYGQAGANVYLYRLSNGAYRKTEYKWTIGASNIFYQRIVLKKGQNALLVYAENNSGSSQNVPLEITYLGTNFQDKVNGLKVDVNSILARR